MEIIILPSALENADPEKTAWSFVGLEPLTIRYKPNLAAVINADIGSEWFFLIYDNEQVDPALCRALPVYEASAFELFICIKRFVENGGMRVFEAPRLFRSHLRPQADSLMPENTAGIRWTRALDGWIESHEHS